MAAHLVADLLYRPLPWLFQGDDRFSTEAPGDPKTPSQLGQEVGRNRSGGQSCFPHCEMGSRGSSRTSPAVHAILGKGARWATSAARRS